MSLEQFPHIAKYDVVTKINGSCIQQDVSAVNSITNIRETIMQIVCDTREKQIRTALIKLGWTPPKEKK